MSILTDRSKDQLIGELDTNILECKKNIENFELALDITEDQDHLVSNIMTHYLNILPMTNITPTTMQLFQAADYYP